MHVGYLTAKYLYRFFGKRLLSPRNVIFYLIFVQIFCEKVSKSAEYDFSVMDGILSNENVRGEFPIILFVFQFSIL